MKPFSKRLNRRKASKVTLKTHRKDSHPSAHDAKVEGGEDSRVRSEEIKYRQ